MVGWPWYLPVLVMGEERLSRVRVVSGWSVVVVSGMVVGKAAGGFGQTAGIRSRDGWYRHKMGRA